MDGQKMYNETQFIIKNPYLNRVLFYIIILVTHKIIVCLIIIGYYGFCFFNA